MSARNAIPVTRCGAPALLLVLLVLCLMLASSARADVYMWKDPETGKTRMTNILPPWLRGAKPGDSVPKVEIIRDGKVLDPATAFAPAEPAPVSTRRRGEAEGAPPGSGNEAGPASPVGDAVAAPGSANAPPPSAQGPPGGPPGAQGPSGVPPDAQVPPGLPSVPGQGQSPAQGSPLPVSR